MKHVIRRAIVLVFVATSCFAQDPARMDEVVQSYVRDKTFMGTVLVARGGDVILNKGYGSANLEWNIPNTPVTKFRLGSLTKQFTAASVLLLVERGKLMLEDPIRKYIPDAPAPDQHSVPVTLRDPYHQPHLQNFFDAIRGKAQLNCPAEEAYQTAVAVLKVNEAVEAHTRLAFKPDDFKA